MDYLFRALRAATLGFALFFFSLMGVDLTTAYLTDSIPGETSRYVLQRTGEFLEKKFTLGITKEHLENSIPQILPQDEEILPKNPISVPGTSTTTVRINPTKAPAPKPKPTLEKPRIAACPTLTTSDLTPSGILIFTNGERAIDGKGGLTWNPTLAKVAEFKARDMEARQYFAHESPSGKGPQDLAQDFKYDYMLVGENLALGDFCSDRDVMDGWMNSPGHRANILKAGYTELGVAAFLGTYKGRPAWFAVQEFGRPNAACPKPDETEKKWIEVQHAKVHNLAVELDEKRTAIDAYSGDGDTKARLVNEFNVLVQNHNQLLDQLKQRIASFNSSVTIYNACLAHARELAGLPATSTPETHS
jgi:uncharacterized protein YkwD